jgi:hypothetical protein
MQPSRLIFLLPALLAGACAHAPVVTGDARGPFDTVQGVYGGNEFSATAPEGPRKIAGEAPVAAPSPAIPAPAVAAQPAPGRAPALAQADDPILIDANAFAAVFGPAPAPVKASAAQLMQLDSLALVAADAMRVELQRKILACRRAGESCRLQGQ